jgi:hypothetical protein
MSAVTNYTTLATALAAQAFGRTDLDTSLAIQLAEAKLNRVLRTRRQTAVATGSFSSGTATLPTDFLGVRGLRLTSGAYTKLEPVSIDKMDELKAVSDTSGEPLYYTVRGDVLEVYPEGASPYRLTYYQKLPGLEANSTNWLISDHPDVYLYAGMVEVALFTGDDALLGTYAPLLETLVGHLNSADLAAQYGDRLSPQVSNAF